MPKNVGIYIFCLYYVALDRNRVPDETSSHPMELKTNAWVRSKIDFIVSLQEPLPATVMRRKLAWFGHVTRQDSLSETILQGTLKGE